MKTFEGHRNRAYPRKVTVTKNGSVPRLEELIAEIPYKHKKKKYIIDGVVVYHIRLKTQEELAFKLAGYEVTR